MVFSFDAIVVAAGAGAVMSNTYSMLDISFSRYYISFLYERFSCYPRHGPFNPYQNEQQQKVKEKSNPGIRDSFVFTSIPGFFAC